MDGVLTLIALGLLGELGQVDGVIVTHFDRNLGGLCVSEKFKSGVMVVFVVVVRHQAAEPCISIMRSVTAHVQPPCVNAVCSELWLESEAQGMQTRDADANSWQGGASHAVEGWS